MYRSTALPHFFVMLVSLVVAGQQNSSLFELLKRAPAAQQFEGYYMNMDSIAFDASCIDPELNVGGYQSSNEQALKSIPEMNRAQYIIGEWSHALMLVADATARFQHTKQTAGTNPGSTQTKQTINHDDPAFTQFFKLDTAINSLNAIETALNQLQRINAAPGQNGRPSANAGGDKVILNCESPTWICGGSSQGSQGSGSDEQFAATLQLDNGQWVIYLCNPFFELPRLADVIEIAQSRIPLEAFQAAKDEDMDNWYWYASRGLLHAYDGSAAQTLIHEWTHIPWIANTNPRANPNDPNSPLNPPDQTGWFETAKFVSQQSANSALYTKNAESYAWYAEWGFLHRVFGSQWPADGPYKKPVPEP